MMLTIEQIKGMSIDQIVELYRNGAYLEGTTPIDTYVNTYGIVDNEHRYIRNDGSTIYLSPGTCPSTVVQGTTKNITVSVGQPGTPPYTYKLYIDSSTIPAYTYGPTTAISHVFPHPFNESLGPHNYKGEVTDTCSAGAKIVSDQCANPINIVTAATLTVSLTVSPNPVTIGSSITLTATPSGGSLTYTNFTWNGLPSGCTNTNSATLTCSPNTAGTYNIAVTVTDSASATATSSVVSLTVNSAVTTGSITGNVKNSSNVNISGATVTCSGGGTSATTDVNGNYTITGVPAGTGYTVTASRTGYNNASYYGVNVIAGSVTPNINIILNPIVTTGSISGNVKNSSNVNISGATVSDGTRSATTDASGNYIISNVPPGTTYTVTASATGYISSSISNVSVTAGVTTPNINFTLSPVATTGSISGNVKNSSNQNISGATVSDGTRSATTDVNGNYTITGVPASTYNVTASKTGYISGTLSNIVVNAGVVTTGVNFILTPSTGSISGNVKNSSNVNISGATVSDGTRSATTDASGNYTISNVPPGSYTVTANATGYIGGSLSGIPVTAGYITSNINFVLSPVPTTGSISGNVKDLSNVNISGATVSDGTRSATTDASGNYTINNVPPNTYTVSASKTGYMNSSLSGVIVTAGYTTTNVNFTLASVPAINISLTASPNPVTAGSSLTLTATASGGSGTYSTYTWNGLPSGCISANSSTRTCSPTTAGTYNVSVTVTDSIGTMATSNVVQLVVNAAPVTVCTWIVAKGGYNNLSVIEILELVYAFIGSTNIGFTPTIPQILGCVYYYIGNISLGNTNTGCNY